MAGHVEGWYCKMIKSCSECPRSASCTEPCDAIKKLLEPEIESTKNDARMTFLDPGEIEKNIKIDVGRKFEDVEDLNVEYFQTPAGPRSIDSSPEDLRIIKKYVDVVLRSDQKKLKGRFLSFLRCNSMVDIATRANVKKQAIHKQFYNIVKKIHYRMSDEKVQLGKTITPYQFKLKLS